VSALLALSSDRKNTFALAFVLAENIMQAPDKRLAITN
jgi:hypothetical protein